MKFLAGLAALALSASSLPAHAGWHANQVAGTGKAGAQGGVTADIYYEDGHLRLDQGKMISVIFEMRTGRMVILDHRQKTFLDDTIQTRIKAQKQMLEALKARRNEVPPAARAQLDQQVEMLERAEQPEPKPKPTGKTAKVGKFECELYAWKAPLSEGELCLAKKIGVDLKRFAADAKVLTKIITDLKGTPPNGIAMFGMADKGFPVRTTQRVRQNESTPWLENTSVVKVMEPIKLGKAKFAIPKGYTKKGFSEFSAGASKPAPPSKKAPPKGKNAPPKGKK